MLAYAEEQDRTAMELEARACALAELSAKTEALSSEINSLVEQAQARLARMRAPFDRK